MAHQSQFIFIFDNQTLVYDHILSIYNKTIPMGSASSVLTHSDIEVVQEHCNYLCEFSPDINSSWICFSYNWIKTTVFNLSPNYVVTEKEIVSLYQRFCQLDGNGKGFISADEFLSHPEFSVNPLSEVGYFSLNKKTIIW